MTRSSSVIHDSRARFASSEYALAAAVVPTVAGMKVLHAPVNVGNQPWVLSRNERALGAESDLVVNYGTWLQLPADRILSDYGRRSMLNVIKRTAFGLSAPFRYDVLHYYFGRSLLNWDDWATGFKFPFLDLKIARRLGKRVFMTLQGCDIRIAGQSSARNEHTPCAKGKCNFFENCITTIDSQRRALAESILPLCDKVYYLNPELGFDAGNGEFLPYASVDIASFPVIPPHDGRKLRIVHAPSDSAVKGTDLILAALESLASTYEFEVVLVQNTPYAQALEIYKSADLAIDQVLAGWYGGFAVEMMAMGKPVLCFLRESDYVNLPDQMVKDLPILNIRPGSLRSDIESVLQRRHEVASWSARSRAYVEKWHDPRRIAAAMLEQYRQPSEPVGNVLSRLR